jgi:hypothetical protein
MQFVGLSIPRENVPTVEVGPDGEVVDLHNDGELRELAYDFVGRTMRLTWSLKEPAWRVPDKPDTSQRSTVASATLLFAGVRSLHMEGDFVTSTEREGGGLDFLEYRRQPPGYGEVRFVFLDDAEIVLVARRCELRTTRSERSN